MERKRGDGVLWEVAELFDLPGEMVGTLPHLELLGDKQLYLERHWGILSYSEEVLDINTPGHGAAHPLHDGGGPAGGRRHRRRGMGALGCCSG